MSKDLSSPEKNQPPDPICAYQKEDHNSTTGLKMKMMSEVSFGNEEGLKMSGNEEQPKGLKMMSEVSFGNEEGLKMFVNEEQPKGLKMKYEVSFGNEEGLKMSGNEEQPKGLKMMSEVSNCFGNEDTIPSATDQKSSTFYLRGMYLNYYSPCDAEANEIDIRDFSALPNYLICKILKKLPPMLMYATLTSNKAYKAWSKNVLVDSVPTICFESALDSDAQVSQFAIGILSFCGNKIQVSCHLDTFRLCVKYGISVDETVCIKLMPAVDTICSSMVSGTSKKLIWI
ncbi:hypothetical protein L195_g016657 [Trifolium pratense]|uniref:F-box domain-containing protein n=1 Tax=Trifolium pratense TaxID=57577 RepID=A0A2K3MRS1_TRIPR|nr:hypothetical protein L195_g016657 [Trifolium pratense]